MPSGSHSCEATETFIFFNAEWDVRGILSA